jgi:MFS family permease
MAFPWQQAYPDMHKGVSHLGPAAVDRVSGLFTMAYATGEVSGPILGGLLYEVIGFGWESFAVGMVILSYGALVLSLLLLRVVPKSGRFVSDVDSVSGLSHSGSLGNGKGSESLA